MRKIFLSLASAVLATAPAFSQLKKADIFELEDPASTSIIILPDPQSYIKFDYNQGIFDLMVSWVKENRKNLNVMTVLCTGDLVDQNSCIAPPFPRFGNLPSEEQWEGVSRIFSRLDNVLPYVISPGNHDYGYTRSESPITEYPRFFPISRNEKNRERLVATTFNRLGVMTLENSAYEYHDPVLGNVLIVTTEYAPRKEVLDWVHELCMRDEYKDWFVIFMTHSYLGAGMPAGYVMNETYKMLLDDQKDNGGQFIWDNLIKDTPNIRMVICGHVAKASKDMQTGNGWRIDRNSAGNEVYQMMFNMQGIDGAMSGNGGDGWLRILEFKPDGKTVKVHTYSPLFGISDVTKEHAREKSPCNDFVFELKR